MKILEGANTINEIILIYQLKQKRMNAHQTIEKMKHMRLTAMAELYHQSVTQNLYQDMTQDEWMAMLIDQEWQDRQNKKIKSLIHRSAMSKNISNHDIDYSSIRKLDKGQYERLLSLQFLKNNENIIFTGPAGIGKSYLAQALGHKACQMLYKTQYYILARLFDHVRMWQVEGRYLKYLKSLQKIHLLIIDDFGLHPFQKGDAQILLDIIENRHLTASTIINAQIPVSQWHELIGEGTISDAILDRIVNTAHRITLEGHSLRKNYTFSSLEN